MAGKETEKKTKSPPSLIAEPVRAKWGNKLQFILSCVGYSVGLGNVWRFSYLAYKNGGGAFLIPYMVAVVTSGLPLYALELAIGQFGSLGPTTAYRRMAPVFQGVGWATVMISFNISMYYNVIIAWTVHYVFESFRSELPWVGCNNTWNTDRCISIFEDQNCDRILNSSGSRFFAKACLDWKTVNDYRLDGTYFNNSGLSVRINGTILNTIEYMAQRSPAEEYYRYYILDFQDSNDFHNLGKLNWRMVGCLAAAWTLIFACLFGGIQTSGKVVYFTAIFPYVVLLIMLIVGVNLDGAGDGMLFYITPNMTKLSNPDIWRQAAVQVFYSLSPGQGGLVTLASYNEFDNDFIRDSIIVTVVDSMTSTFAGFTTFSIVGYVAHILNVTVDKAVAHGPGLAFIVFPTAIATLPVPQLWSVLFFLMLVTLGLDSEFVLYETVTTALIDQFPILTKHKTLVVGGGCVACFLLGLPFCTQGGLTVFTVYDDYSSGYVVMLLALYETMVISWVYGLGKFLKDIYRMRGHMLNYYWRVTWAIVTPLYMLVIFITTIVLYAPSEVFDKVIPPGAQAMGWFLSSMPMLALLFFAIFRVVEAWQKKLPWESLVMSTPHWCPAVDLARRSPARHEGSARMHLLDHPYHPHPLEGEVVDTSVTASSKLKSVGSGSKTVSVPSVGFLG